MLVVAQTCEQLSKRADQFYTISNIDDYEYYKTFKNKKELISNLDSAIFYKESLLKLGSCFQSIPYHLSDLALFYYINSNNRKAKNAANSLINLHSEVSYSRNEKVIKYDSLGSMKFEAYKILGKIYLQENKEDSLFWIAKVLDSLKTSVYYCPTGLGRTNVFVAELKSNFYEKNRRYNEALLIWYKTDQKGNRYINKRIVEILGLKYTKNLKKRFKINEVERGEYNHYVTLTIKDEIIDSLLINLPIDCKGDTKDCLSKIDYLKSIY